MKPLFFIVMLLIQFAVQVSFKCRKGSYEQWQWSWRTFLFTTTCWMIALGLSVYDVRRSKESEQMATVEGMCSAAMLAISTDPGNPLLGQMASNIYSQVPRDLNSKSAKALKGYVHRVAESWDNSKELQSKKSIL